MIAFSRNSIERLFADDAPEKTLAFVLMRRPSSLHLNVMCVKRNREIGEITDALY